MNRSLSFFDDELFSNVLNIARPPGVGELTSEGRVWALGGRRGFSFKISLRLRLISWKLMGIGRSRSLGDSEVILERLDLRESFEIEREFSLKLNSCSYFVIFPFCLDGEHEPRSIEALRLRAEGRVRVGCLLLSCSSETPLKLCYEKALISLNFLLGTAMDLFL